VFFFFRYVGEVNNKQKKQRRQNRRKTHASSVRYRKRGYWKRKTWRRASATQTICVIWGVGYKSATLTALFSSFLLSPPLVPCATYCSGASAHRLGVIDWSSVWHCQRSSEIATFGKGHSNPSFSDSSADGMAHCCIYSLLIHPIHPIFRSLSLSTGGSKLTCYGPEQGKVCRLRADVLGDVLLRLISETATHTSTGRSERLASGETFGLNRLLTIAEHVSRWPSIPQECNQYPL